MPTILELKEQRANKWTEMRSILDTADEAKRDLTAEERSTYDNLDSELETLSTEIDGKESDADRRKRAEERGREFDADPTGGDPTPTPRGGDEPAEEQAYREAFIAFVRGGMAELDGDMRKALRSGWQADEGKEGRAAGVGTGSAGGYLVPQGFRRQIVEKLKDYGAVQNVAQVITTSTGNALPWPTNDDTGNVGALLAENTQVTEQDITLGTAQLGAYKYTSKLVRVSIEFLQDVDWLDAEGFLARKFAERLGRITNQHFTTGTGTAQPQGIVTGATSGVTAAAVAAITLDELIDLEHSVDPAYRRSPSVRYMLSDTALKLVRKLKDSQGRYLWEPSVQAGVPNSLHGYQYEVNNDMAVPATGVKSVLFGDFSAGYVIRVVRGIQMIRMDERYADYFQVGFVSFERTDGLVQDTSAYKALTQA